MARPPAWRFLHVFLVLVAAVAMVAHSGCGGRKSLPPPVTRNVTIPTTEGPPLDGYLALPAGGGPFPAVVLVHGVWGLDGWLRGLTSRLAGRGFVALAVDLYGGRVPDDEGRARRLMVELDPARARGAIRDAVAYVRSLPSVRAEAVALMGWSLGASYALDVAVKDAGVAACVLYYGGLIREREVLQRLRASVVAFYGDSDPSIKGEVVEFGRRAAAMGKDVKIYVYRGVRDGFATPRSAYYDERAARDAWEKALRFLRERLGR